MKFNFEIPVDAPAITAWRLVGEQFGQIDQWSENISESYLEGELGEGAVRVCKSDKAFGPFKPATVKEKLLHYDASSMSFSYLAISGIPGFMAHASNHWIVIPIGDDKCLIRLSPQVELIWILKPFTRILMWLMRKDMALFSQQLKNKIEQQ